MKVLENNGEPNYPAIHSKESLGTRIELVQI